MYIVARSIKRKSKKYVQGNGKDKGKGAPQILKEEELEGIDYQTIHVFHDEQEALDCAEERMKGNPNSEYLIFMATRRYKSKEPTIIFEDLV